MTASKDELFNRATDVADVIASNLKMDSSRYFFWFLGVVGLPKEEARVRVRFQQGKIALEPAGKAIHPENPEGFFHDIEELVFFSRVIIPLAEAMLQDRLDPHTPTFG